MACFVFDKLFFAPGGQTASRDLLVGPSKQGPALPHPLISYRASVAPTPRVTAGQVSRFDLIVYVKMLSDCIWLKFTEGN